MLSVGLSVVWIDDPKSLGKGFFFLGISCLLNSRQTKSCSWKGQFPFGGGVGWTDLLLPMRYILLSARLSPIYSLSSYHINWKSFIKNTKHILYRVNIQRTKGMRSTSIQTCPCWRKYVKYAEKININLLYRENAGKDRVSGAAAPSEKHLYLLLLPYSLSSFRLTVLLPLFLHAFLIYAVGFFLGGSYTTPTPTSIAHT